MKNNIHGSTDDNCLSVVMYVISHSNFAVYIVCQHYKRVSQVSLISLDRLPGQYNHFFGEYKIGINNLCTSEIQSKEIVIILHGRQPNVTASVFCFLASKDARVTVHCVQARLAHRTFNNVCSLTALPGN